MQLRAFVSAQTSARVKILKSKHKLATHRHASRVLQIHGGRRGQRHMRATRVAAAAKAIVYVGHRKCVKTTWGVSVTWPPPGRSACMLVAHSGGTPRGERSCCDVSRCVGRVSPQPSIVRSDTSKLAAHNRPSATSWQATVRLPPPACRSSYGNALDKRAASACCTAAVRRSASAEPQDQSQRCVAPQPAASAAVTSLLQRSADAGAHSGRAAAAT